MYKHIVLVSSQRVEILFFHRLFYILLLSYFTIDFLHVITKLKKKIIK